MQCVVAIGLQEVGISIHGAFDGLDNIENRYFGGGLGQQESTLGATETAEQVGPDELLEELEEIFQRYLIIPSNIFGSQGAVGVVACDLDHC